MQLPTHNLLPYFHFILPGIYKYCKKQSNRPTLLDIKNIQITCIICSFEYTLYYTYFNIETLIHTVCSLYFNIL